MCVYECEGECLTVYRGSDSAVEIGGELGGKGGEEREERRGREGRIGEDERGGWEGIGGEVMGGEEREGNDYHSATVL